jgi:hypothetical protein
LRRRSQQRKKRAVRAYMLRCCVAQAHAEAQWQSVAVCHVARGMCDVRHVARGTQWAVAVDSGQLGSGSGQWHVALRLLALWWPARGPPQLVSIEASWPRRQPTGMGPLVPRVTSASLKSEI